MITNIRAFPLGDFCHPGFDIFVCRVDRMGDPTFSASSRFGTGKIGNNYGRGTFQGRQSADQPNGPAAQYQHRIFRMDIGRFQAMRAAGDRLNHCRPIPVKTIDNSVRQVLRKYGRGIRINSLNPPRFQIRFLELVA